MFLSSKIISPVDALFTPLIVINKVDLPAPFEPIKVTISPLFTFTSTPLNAWIFP